jgi:hypothetical protein
MKKIFIRMLLAVFIVVGRADAMQENNKNLDLSNYIACVINGVTYHVYPGLTMPHNMAIERGFVSIRHEGYDRWARRTGLPLQDFSVAKNAEMKRFLSSINLVLSAFLCSKEIKSQFCSCSLKGFIEALSKEMVFKTIPASGSKLTAYFISMFYSDTSEKNNDESFELESNQKKDTNTKIKKISKIAEKIINHFLNKNKKDYKPEFLSELFGLKNDKDLFFDPNELVEMVKKERDILKNVKPIIVFQSDTPYQDIGQNNQPLISFEWSLNDQSENCTSDVKAIINKFLANIGLSSENFMDEHKAKMILDFCKQEKITVTEYLKNLVRMGDKTLILEIINSITNDKKNVSNNTFGSPVEIVEGINAVFFTLKIDKSNFITIKEAEKIQEYCKEIGMSVKQYVKNLIATKNKGAVLSALESIYK